MRRPPIDVCIKVGDRIRYWRKQRDMTQEMLSALAGLSRINLSKIENGKAEPGIRTVYSISQALNLKMTELFITVD
jgi:transcriptional regulator with XRE-family HTH domain